MKRMAARRLDGLCRHLSCHPPAHTDTFQPAVTAIAGPGWIPLETSAAALQDTTQSSRYARDDLLARVAKHDVPAIVIRDALSKDACSAALHQVAKRQAFSSDFLEAVTLPPGAEVSPADERPGAVQTFPGDGRIGSAGDGSWEGRLWYIGTSFGRLANKDREEFFAQSATTNHFFADAWQLQKGGADDGADDADPLTTMMQVLSALSGGRKRAAAAVECHRAEGAPAAYGAAILRCYKPMAQCHKPHFDSVRQVSMNEAGGLADWEVGRFDTQLAAVLLLNEPDAAAKTSDATLFRCEGSSTEAAELRALQSAVARSEGAAERAIDVAQVALSVGDMYVFKADALHEVPGFGGSQARVVLASFVAYSETRPELMCWA
eukprot:SAG31_NODE_784_length_12112_cov_10.538666_1_plen_378_part_10